MVQRSHRQLTSSRINTAPYNPDVRLDWRLIVNGFIDEPLVSGYNIAEENYA